MQVFLDMIEEVDAIIDKSVRENTSCVIGYHATVLCLYVCRGPPLLPRYRAE